MEQKGGTPENGAGGNAWHSARHGDSVTTPLKTQLTVLRSVAGHLPVRRPVKVLRTTDESLVARDATLIRRLIEGLAITKKWSQRLIHLREAVAYMC